MKALITSLILMTAFTAHAGEHEGGNGSGGGDILCENRIEAIRNDIAKWIVKGGAKDLRYSSGLTADVYAKRMSEVLPQAAANVRCVSKGDDGFPVRIGSSPKICRFDLAGFGSLKTSTITCDQRKFLALGEREQYQQIHHEYAGLARVENPDGASSTYEYSDQITSELTPHEVLMLDVKSVGSSVPKPQNAYQRCEMQAQPYYSKFMSAIAALEFAAVMPELKARKIKAIPETLQELTDMNWMRSLDYGSGTHLEVDPKTKKDIETPSHRFIKFQTRSGQTLVIMAKRDDGQLIQTRPTTSSEGVYSGCVTSILVDDLFEVINYETHEPVVRFGQNQWGDSFKQLRGNVLLALPMPK